MTGPRQPRLKTVKRLFALSGNSCAFTGCPARLVDETGVVTGVICHIRAHEPGGPRYEATQSDEERHGFDNLVLMCSPHHKRVGVRTLFIEPGSPWENGYNERFNGTLRDELLNGEIFYTLAEARALIERWRAEYNHVRPHSALGYKPPAPVAWRTDDENRTSPLPSDPGGQRRAV